MNVAFSFFSCAGDLSPLACFLLASPYMATAKRVRRGTRGVPARGRKAEKSPKKTLPELYLRLEKTQPGSEESQRISAQIVDAIG
jgi:hypothetical protein